MHHGKVSSPRHHMSDSEQPHSNTHIPDDVSVVALPDGPRVDHERRRRPPRAPKPRPDNWGDIQELRNRLAEHEETVEKLRAAFGMISVALGVGLPQGGFEARVDDDAPAHRPGRMTRRGGANSVNTSHYKNNNRGGGGGHGHNGNGVNGGYRGYRGGAPGFRNS